jgi:uncharacterized membrane protein YgcG
MRFWMFTVLFLLGAMPSFAQIVAQPGEVNELAPNNVAKNAMALSPEMRQKLMDKFQNMTPQQRQSITDQAKSAWQGMSPQNKDMLKAKAMEQYNALTPAQKQQMQDQAMQKWQTLSPQEKEQLTSQFKVLLQGSLAH